MLGIRITPKIHTLKDRIQRMAGLSLELNAVLNSLSMKKWDTDDTQQKEA